MTIKTKDDPNEPHFGELGAYLLKKHFAETRFGMPVDPDLTKLAERAFRLSVEFRAADLELLHGANSGIADSSQIAFDQLAHLYNVICHRLLYVAPGAFTRKPVLIVSSPPLSVASDEGASVFFDGVLVFGDGNAGRLAYNMARLVETHPLHRSTLIASMAAVPIGDGSMEDAIHEVIAPTMTGAPGWAFRVFDRPARRLFPKDVIAAAAQRHRPKAKGRAIKSTDIVATPKAAMETSAAGAEE